LTRLALLADSKLAIVSAGEDAVVLAPPPPRDPVADVAAGVRDSLRFPLAGEPLEALVTRGARATVVVDLPAQPVPQTPIDPRPQALAAALDELERAGVPSDRTTILVAGGLARRAGKREIDHLVLPEVRRRFRGSFEVHDAASPDLAPLSGDGLRDVRVHPALLETDLVLTLSAAESVIHGGASVLVGAADANTIRAADAYSLLETTASRGWLTSSALERALARRVRLIGVSLVLTLPKLTGMLQGYPYEEESVDRLVRSPLRHLFGVLPGSLRRRALKTIPASRGVSAVFSGPPSVAHAEALLRGIEERARALPARLDAICLGVPGTTPYLPRERPNPLLAAFLGLGLALRMWRDSFPVVDGGAAILVHPFERRFAHPSQQPYRDFFRSLRPGSAREPEHALEAELAAGADERALTAYRDGRAHHPLLPYADWSACGPALGRLGAVFVAGCRDHDAARALGLIPTHGVGAALQMAEGRAGKPLRIGFLLAPPFFPLRVRA
jgi:hypothetical protein